MVDSQSSQYNYNYQQPSSYNKLQGNNGSSQSNNQPVSSQTNITPSATTKQSNSTTPKTATPSITSYDKQTGTYTDSSGQGFSMAAPPTTSGSHSGSSKSSTSNVPIISTALKTGGQALGTLLSQNKEVQEVKQSVNNFQSGLKSGYQFGGSQADVLFNPQRVSSQDTSSFLTYTGKGGEITTAPKVDAFFKLGQQISSPVGRATSSLSPDVNTAWRLQSNDPMVKIPAGIGTATTLVGSIYTPEGLIAAKEGYTVARTGLLASGKELISTSPLLEKGLQTLEWAPKTKTGAFIKTAATYIPETIVLGELGTKGNIALTGQYNNNEDFQKAISRANANVIQNQGLVGGFLESTPGINIPYGAVAETNKKFRESFISDLRDTGKYTEPEIQNMADVAIGYRQRAKPIELLSAILPSTLIEGAGRQQFNIVFDDLAKKGEMLPSTAVKEIAGGTSRWSQNMFNPKGKAFWTTAPLGLLEGVGQDYVSQRSQVGGKGFTGIKNPVEAATNFLSSTSDSKQLSPEESSNILAEIKSQGISGTQVTVPNTNTETILNTITGQKETKVTTGTIDATKYRLDKDGKIYNVFMDKDGNIIGGGSANDISTQYDPFRGALSGLLGGYSSGVMQKSIMTRQVKDLPVYFGGDVKPNSVTTSGKFTWKDYSPFYTKPVDTGKVSFGTSTADTGSQMIGVTPSAFKQKMAYLSDWTEKPGDVTQDWTRGIRRELGRTVTEPTMSYAGRVIPVKTQTSTYTSLFVNPFENIVKSNTDLGTSSFTQTTVSQKESPTQITSTGTSTSTDVNQKINNILNTNMVTGVPTDVTPTTRTSTRTNAVIPVDVPTNIDTNTATNVNTNVGTNVATNIGTNVGTFQKFSVPLAAWPSLGGFPGGSNEGSGRGSLVGGVNVNYLRNFFFEKVKKENVGNKKVMMSRNPTSKKVISNSDKLISMLGTKKIVSNSSPFPKNMKRMIKRKK